MAFFCPVDRFSLRLERAEYMISMTIFADLCIKQLGPKSFEARERAFLVRFRELVVTNDVGREDCLSERGLWPLSQLTVAPTKGRLDPSRGQANMSG